MEREVPLVWRLVGAIAGLLLTLGLSAAPATAAESEFGPEDIERAKEAYPSDSISDQVSRLETRAWVEFPNTFAGLWINDGDYSEIFVSFSKNAAESLDRIVELEGFSDRDALRLVKAEYSVAELEADQRRLTQQRDFVEAEQPELVESTGISDYGSDIDVRTNKLKIFAEGEAKEYVSEFAEAQLDVPFEIVDGGLASPYCGGTRWGCGYWMRGGLGTWINPLGVPAGTYVRCTTAFTVRNGSSRPVLSAGHCGDRESPKVADIGNQRFYGLGTPGTLFGSVQDQLRGGRVDAERISVGNGFHAHPWIYRDHSTPSWSITSRGTWAGFTIGQQYCKSGIMTGRTCGNADGKNFSGVDVPGANRFLRVINQNATFGDSGAPLYQQHQAVGILHGGSPQVGAVYGHIEYAENSLGVVVDTE